ncbi:MAG: SDR family NAD(P)-dependent oxidoreductase [Phormidesmis sp.]
MQIENGPFGDSDRDHLNYGDFDHDGFSLTGKVALVNSSRAGICAESAHQLAAAGARVVVCGLNASQGNKTVAEIQRSGGQARFILTDVSMAVDVQAAIDETIATFGRLDILLNFASDDYERDGSLLEVSETAWDRIIETTLKGAFLCCQYALPFLQQAGNGKIINLVEQTASAQDRLVASICQGGVVAMTYAIAQQFSGQSVSANLIWVIQPALAPSSIAPESLTRALEKILYGPTTEDTDSPPFANAAEAISHLVSSATNLHGHALVVNIACE